MTLLRVLAVISLVGLVFGILTDQAGIVLLAVLGLLASLFLFVRGLLARRGKRASRKWILIDGSNVLHWDDGTPQLATLRLVIDRLTALGFTPGVVLDANAGYKISDRYQHHDAFARLLRLPEDRVMVVAKGTPADPTLLATARDLGARIVTNDRFRDWAEAYPEVTKPGHLIRGGFTAGKLWLDLD